MIRRKRFAAYEAMQASGLAKSRFTYQYLQQHEISEEMEENRFMTDDLTLNRMRICHSGCGVNTLREAILKRRLKPGERLMELRCCS